MWTPKKENLFKPQRVLWLSEIRADHFREKDLHLEALRNSLKNVIESRGLNNTKQKMDILDKQLTCIWAVI